MKAIILSAGRGERMRPLTDNTPKALLRVGEKALIEYHLEALAAAGVTDVVINLAWLGEQIPERLGNGSRYGLAIEYSHEGQAALETGGGIVHALELLGPQPFWVVNGDIYTNFTFDNNYLADSDLGRLVLVPNPEHNPAGDFGLSDARVVNSAQQMHTYSGIALFRPELFAGQQEDAFPLAPILRTVVDQDRLAGQLHEGLWIDVGTPARLAQVERIRVRQGAVRL
ncbi:MAG: nucleotidyltransferase family protein [Gammaproteobacteria bacterium]|nr:nucleotidyltransferase family protein [Gammaproteobacteria bacterium]